MRGISYGDQYTAGRYPCERMEPFVFIEEEFNWLVLWEIPYPRKFSGSVDVYERNIEHDKLYELVSLYFS